MKKLALATVAMLSATTFLAASKESAKPRQKTNLVAEKTNFEQQRITNSMINDPLTVNKADLAQAD